MRRIHTGTGQKNKCERSGKVLFVLLLVLTALVLLSGCTGKKATEAPKNHRMKIVTTIFPPYDFARQISGGKAEVRMLLKPGQETHLYEPTPRDIRMIRHADLFIYTGGENDTWVKDILDGMGKDAPKTLRLIDCTDTLEEETVEGMEPEHEHHKHREHAGKIEEDAPEFDEHVWTSPRKAAEITEAIAKEMEQMDPKNRSVYVRNTRHYVKQLAKLEQSFRDVVRHGKRKTVLFGDRFPLRYLAEDLGLKYYAAFSGCSGNSEASAATVVFLTKKVREDRLPVVFRIELSQGRIARSVAEATGARVMTFSSCHNVTARQMRRGVTYLELMKKNVEVLRYALNHDLGD